jgi:hypothetical protein
LAIAAAGLALIHVVGVEERAWHLLASLAVGPEAGHKGLPLVAHHRVDMAP